MLKVPNPINSLYIYYAQHDIITYIMRCGYIIITKTINIQLLQCYKIIFYINSLRLVCKFQF